MDIHNVRHWFFDLDGTVYLGAEAIPGAHQFISYLDSEQISYSFLTNNSSKSGYDYHRKLLSLGFSIEQDRVFTSGQAAAQYVARNHPDTPVYLLGTPSLAAEFGAAHVPVSEEAAEAVVIGYDTNLSYARLTHACRLLQDGLPYFVTHSDATCPHPEGPLPDTGSFIALIERATGRTPDAVIGKPNLEFIKEAGDRYGVRPEHSGMIGDRLETDIEMAIGAGSRAVLVLTGVTKKDDPRLAMLDGVDVIENLSELHHRLRGKECQTSLKH